MIYPSSGTGAWEAALVNMLSPGDHVVMYETGQFAALWAQAGRAPGPVDRNPGMARQRRRSAGSAGLAAWRAGGPDRGTPAHGQGTPIKAVCVVHNETSTGVTSDIAAVRKASMRPSIPRC